MKNQANESGASPPIPVLPLGASLASFFGGVALLLDDVKDFGKFGEERNPPIPHHWIYGVILMCGGLVGLGLSMMNLITSDPKVAEALRNRAEELRIARKTLPPEMFEKLVGR